MIVHQHISNIQWNAKNMQNLKNIFRTIKPLNDAPNKVGHLCRDNIINIKLIFCREMFNYQTMDFWVIRHELCCIKQFDMLLEAFNKMDSMLTIQSERTRKWNSSASIFNLSRMRDMKLCTCSSNFAQPNFLSITSKHGEACLTAWIKNSFKQKKTKTWCSPERNHLQKNGFELNCFWKLSCKINRPLKFSRHLQWG